MTLQRRTVGAVATVLVVLVAIQPGHGQAGAENPAAIKPFKAHIPDSVLADLTAPPGGDQVARSTAGHDLGIRR